MCGIVGFTGDMQAAPILLDGLSKLEYRGYDSAGIAVRDGEKETEVIKAKGRLKVLAEKTNGGESVPGTCGIGHTRWATHGEPSETNAHPHISDDGNVVAVHNGIIENYQELKDKLIRKGYSFYSATDTEVAVKLVDYYYKKYLGTPVDAINHALIRIRGSYALAMMFRDYPGEIYVARKDSPMILGVDGENSYIASDVPAILKYTRNVYYIGNLEMARVRKGEITFYNLDGDEIQKELKTVEWDAEAAEKAGFEHFMMKEIHEQPYAISETLRGRVEDNDRIILPELEILKERITTFNKVYFVACGTAYHACLSGANIMERLTGIPTFTQAASEFRYGDPIIDEKTLCIFVSQSGETADTMAALRLAKNKGCTTIAVANVLGSTISREAEATIYTCAGPEIAVASTKAYTTQVIVLLLLAMYVAQTLGKENDIYKDIINGIAKLPKQIENILKDEPLFEKYANYLKNQKDAYYIGRSLDYTSVLEGALKLKEVSYIHADAYIAGELKHGPIALIEEGSVVIAVATQPHIASKTISNIQETIARGAKVILFTLTGEEVGNVDETYYMPDVNPILQAVLVAIPLQLISYYAAKLKGCDVDKPRNLAKSVTVE